MSVDRLRGLRGRVISVDEAGGIPTFAEPQLNRFSEPGSDPGVLRVEFTIEGKAVGYYTQGARANWTRLSAYNAYKKTVQLSAIAHRIRLPLRATEAAPVWVMTRLFAISRVHHDPENVHKGIVDALFYGSDGGDKHVGGRFEPATYGERDAVEVVIEVRGRQG